MSANMSIFAFYGNFNVSYLFNASPY